MVKAASIEKLRRAFDELAALQEDRGLTLTFSRVCKHAGISRATAYRGDSSFKAEFDAKIEALKVELDPAGGDPADTRAALRMLTAKLANQVQALSLELAMERSKQAAIAKSTSGEGRVVPFAPRGGN